MTGPVIGIDIDIGSQGAMKAATAHETLHKRGAAVTVALSLSNSLSDLGARIRVEHHATSAALKSSVEHAMAAGDLLLEAKALVAHGQWLPWLAEHCEMSERTAQLYMRTAKNREAVELQMRNAIADLTLNEAAALLFLTSDLKKLLAFTKQISETTNPEQVVALCIENGIGVIHDTSYNMWFGVTEGQKRDWTFYVRFLIELGASRDGAGWSVEWLRQRPFVSVDEWLGADGAGFRRQNGMRALPDGHVALWHSFAAERAGLSQKDIESETMALPESVERVEPARIVKQRVVKQRVVKQRRNRRGGA